MTIQHDQLAALTAAIFENAGSGEAEAATIATHLVEYVFQRSTNLKPSDNKTQQFFH